MSYEIAIEAAVRKTGEGDYLISESMLRFLRKPFGFCANPPCGQLELDPWYHHDMLAGSKQPGKFSNEFTSRINLQLKLKIGRRGKVSE